MMVKGELLDDFAIGQAGEKMQRMTRAADL